jgi:very-short-patch-repair endonuclease/predicted transcriptional regulator of viral defense system
MGVTCVTDELGGGIDARQMATKQGRLASLSRKQFGVVQRAQLLELGFSSSGICRASRKGELARFLPGVWRVTSAPRCWEQRPLGAVLWAGEPTVASHITSAHLQEVLPRSATVIEITSPRSSAGRPGIITHRCNLQNVEMVNVRGIPCTSIYRTLVDLCASQPQCISEQALDAALRMGRVSYERLCDYARDAASRSVKGSRTLKGLLHARGSDEALSESEAESLFGRLMRKGGLSQGIRQAPRAGIRGGRIDFFYPDQDLVIEIDSRKFHAGRIEQKRDKRYDNELNIHGKRVLRLTWEDLTTDEDYVLDVVGRALGIQRLF